MQRSGRSRGRALRRGAIGTLFLLAPAGCGGATSSSSSAPADRQTGPVFGQTVRLERVSGSVRVAPPGGGLTALTGARLVPVGTAVDTSAGAVALTSATPARRRVQSGQFHGGLFQIRQDRARGGLVDLVIRDRVSRRRACGVRARLSARILGLLRGNAVGRFRTVGRFAAGTVRGTEWGVRDRCDGTLVVVTRGSVTVRDFRRGRSIVVHAGHTYLASAA